MEAAKEVMALPDDHATDVAQREAKKKPLEELLQEFKSRQGSKEEVPVSRSKWNVKKESPSQQKVAANPILGDSDNVNELFPVKDLVSEYTTQSEIKEEFMLSKDN